MMMEKMFELATRTKMRFPFKGMISVEDLWDLSVQSLDSIYKTLNSQLKQAQEESLLLVKKAEDKELELKVELIKYIVQVKLDEAQVRAQAKEKKEMKQKLMEIRASKQNEELLNKTTEELDAMIAELDK